MHISETFHLVRGTGHILDMPHRDRLALRGFAHGKQQRFDRSLGSATTCGASQMFGDGRTLEYTNTSSTPSPGS
ncbi:hypothetical protein [Kitasatospora sp. NPDC094011]|uniref:hypothetical protein n=1 Tax=Kitasatospora sp. NPDC094011 TaxID=3364090 RepID=UPI0037F7EB20